jgi:pSer/pThr/pTyr-binding forkhead associated (FHA) protein
MPPGADKCPSCGTDLQRGTAAMPVVGVDRADLPSPRIVAPATEPTLVVVKGPEAGERFAIERERLTVGRDPDSDVFLNDVTVSRLHAVVTRDALGVTIRDEESLNGTYVNGEGVDAHVLEEGDHVQIGRFLMVFFAGGE